MGAVPYLHSDESSSLRMGLFYFLGDVFPDCYFLHLATALRVKRPGRPYVISPEALE